MRTKSAFKMKKKAFFIIFEGLSLKQIIKRILEGQNIFQKVKMFYDDSEASGENMCLKNISSAFISIYKYILSIFWIHNYYKMVMQLSVVYSANKKN